MDLTKWMFFKFLLITAAGILLTFPAAAEKSESDLTCDVSQQHDGAFVYLLSKPPSSASCTMEWEDKNKTSIAFNQDSDPKLVLNVTNRSISLRTCLDYLHCKRNCLEGFEEAHCRVNCSSFLDKFSENLIKNSTENSTLICIHKNWCPKKLHVGLFFGGMILLILCFIVGQRLYRKYDLFQCRRQSSVTETTSYTAATNEIKIDLSGVKMDEDDD